jgi:hypothetical protein
VTISQMTLCTALRRVITMTAETSATADKKKNAIWGRVIKKLSVVRSQSNPSVVSCPLLAISLQRSVKIPHEEAMPPDS